MYSISRLSTGQKEIHEPTLVAQLNLLLTSLNLPIPVISPTDLTPSLLIAILESILGTRIPFIDNQKQPKDSKGSNIQNMKIFLGVLETDILQKDVGLSELDPRKLADGEWEEVLYIAELLCWIGRRLGYIPRDKKKEEKSTFILSPGRKVTLTNLGPSRTTVIGPLSPKSQLDLDAESVFQGGASTVAGSTKRSQRTFSFIRTADGESVTSLNTGDFEDESCSQDEESDDASDILTALSPFTRPNQLPRRCIHEVPSPSLLFSLDIPAVTPPESKALTGHTSFCDCDASVYNTLHTKHDREGDQPRPPVRYDGFIEPVNEELELASFESTRPMPLPSTGNASGEKVKLIPYFHPGSTLTDATDQNYEEPIHSNARASN